ncbi:hypothetical protein [Tenacibaculum dicentrarchi]|uniref:hypothetical protein n=1 Tax=Tenacibaculum dicentrarchi TaxID=669041 RepID=UPI000C43A77E|nr:hypothetical protein [Tenacibaculum dicentrarchi]MCD8435661.1 hypothetical protein [Tenacibaculum dicentrarchi]MCD8443093.1 hypothetical protein [Tenacibaculum dicentrarchi]SOS48940.1 hypothetical protein TNO021_40056 [Tenacibaculum dicentrarchi]
MTTTKVPIGEIINFLYNNDDLFNIDFITRKVRNLIDLISVRVNKDGVVKTLESLENDLFNLRLEIIKESDLFNDLIENLNNTIEKRIESQFNDRTKHPELELAFVNSINIYREVSDSIIKGIKLDSINSHIPNLSYSDYISILNSLPGRESKLISSSLKSSIALDFAFIVSELIFDDKLSLKKSEIENLILMLKNSTEDFAVYSNQFGFWKPSLEDESQWARNIKIRISLFNSQFISNTLTLDSLNKLIIE